MNNQEYQARLLTMLEEITKELESVGMHNPENGEDWIATPEEKGAEEPDENVSADNVESWNERTALVATLEADYNNIRSALARIEAQTYGTCEVCGSPIEEKRLDASPTARTCITHREEILS